LVASLLQLITGHRSVVGVSVNQPTKLAAMEGHYNSGQPLDLTVLGYVDTANGQTHGLTLPRVGSFLLAYDFTKPVMGLNSVPVDERPMVQPVFQFYHLMILCGFMLVGLAIVSAFKWWRGTLWDSKWCLRALVWAVVLPQIANQCGWFTAELGRQPWIVYHMLKTSEALSRSVKANLILTSLILFTLVYVLLGFLFFYLLDRKIKEGPDEGPSDRPTAESTPLGGGLVNA
jgi:cytochrome d ubiquinol oxidase subunit I